MIEHFIWTEHAKRRCGLRLLDRIEVEHAIHVGHSVPRINRGQADWRVHGLTGDGRRLWRSTTTPTTTIRSQPES